MDRIVKDEWQKRLNRMENIFGKMILRADKLSTTRCPYKNRFEECTAKFGCRNKRKSRLSSRLPMCGGDEKLDYRSAWDTEASDTNNG